MHCCTIRVHLHSVHVRRLAKGDAGEYKQNVSVCSIVQTGYVHDRHVHESPLHVCTHCVCSTYHKGAIAPLYIGMARVTKGR